MYAEWNIGTTGVTTVTKFGVAGGYWAKIPDAFPPIQHIDTSSIAIPTNGDVHGCIITSVDTTTTDTGTVVRMAPARVAEYITGDKWFRFANQPAAATGAVTAGRQHTTVRLYYRDVTEVGPITV